MSAKRIEKGEVEEPIKKGPLLIVSLVLLLVFLAITGFYLVRWYLEILEEQVETVNSGRVLLSGVAVLVLIIFTVLGLVNAVRGKKTKTPKKPVAKRKTPFRTTSPAKRKKTRKTT